MGLHQSVSAQILDKKQADIISSKFVFIEINIVLLFSQDQCCHLVGYYRWCPVALHRDLSALTSYYKSSTKLSKQTL